MSRSIIQPTTITTEIDGVTSFGMLAFGMRAVIVEKDDSVILRYFVREGSEVKEGTIVKEGDVIGLPGRLPEMLMIGGARYTIPRIFKLNSGSLVKMEVNFYGSDGRYYIARLCNVVILQEDETFGMELGLDGELVEQDLYAADESVISGKTVINVTALYGIREEEIKENEKDLPLSDWLEKKRNLGELFFWSPYEQLLWLEVDMNNLIHELEKRMFHRS